MYCACTVEYGVLSYEWDFCQLSGDYMILYSSDLCLERLVFCVSISLDRRLGLPYVAIGLEEEHGFYLGPSSGFFFSQSAGEHVLPKFDMHTYTSNLTVDEVNNLVKEYVIPLDLRPRVPPSTLTMNNLPTNRIAFPSTYFPISSARLESVYYVRNILSQPRHKSTVDLFRAFYKLNKQGHWFFFERRSGKGGHDKIFNEFCSSLKIWKDRFFLIDRRAVPDAMPWRHHDSSVADPPPTGVRAADIRRLCENVIDLRPVHPAMLYEIGLTTIWKHVGHHPVFKDGEGNVATSMSQFLKFPLAGGVRISKGPTLKENEAIVQHTTLPLPSETPIPEKSDYQKVVEHEDERVLDVKRKAQAAISCPCCGTCMETISHVLFTCCLAKEVWSKIVRWCQVHMPEVGSFAEWVS
ncbi:gypsy type transposase [Tanacetum coccineum]